MKCDCEGYNCPVDATLDMIGGELKGLIKQATPKMLTQQLRELEKDGLIVRTVYPVVPPKVEYALSDKGKSIRPILEAMYDWGASHLRGMGLEVNCSMAPHGPKETG